MPGNKIQLQLVREIVSAGQELMRIERGKFREKKAQIIKPESL